MRDFAPSGYDQRQYCSPGFNLPMGCFMRTPHGEYPEYHTSADNLQFVTSAALGESARIHAPRAGHFRRGLRILKSFAQG